ncbi:Titin, partial [Armadillidium vulgare]
FILCRVGLPPGASPPVFDQIFRNARFAQGGDALFEGKVTGNPKPTVSWTRKGQKIFHGPKYQVTHDQNTGIVTFQICAIGPGDEGEYVCTASNEYGEIEVGQTGPLQGIPQAPNVQQKPRSTKVAETNNATFTVKIAANPSPRIIWFKNGERITPSDKYLMSQSAGQVTLVVKNVNANDGGHYTMLAENTSGCTVTSAQLAVVPKGSDVNGLAEPEIIRSEKIETFQMMEESGDESGKSLEPKFVRIPPHQTVQEGKLVRFDCRATGRPYPDIQSDGGASILQILSASAADAGWYQCTAQNVAGSVSTRARLHVQTSKPGAQSAPQRPHFPRPTKVIEPEKEPEPEIIYLRHIERSHQQMKGPEEEPPTEAPKFTHFLRDIEVAESKRAHFEARVIPLGDATMQIEWLIDGRPLPASSRATVTYRFGYVALDVLNVIDQDAGVYTCRASNVMGQAETSANLRVTDKPVIESGTQHPDALQKISYLEDQHKYQRTESVDEQSNIKPTFVKTLNDLGDIYEGKYAHFEAQIHPVSDPYMKIEWFKDGKPITASSRINVIFNFGYVALTIMHVRQEDTGIYTVRATNKVGECTCQASVRVISLSNVTGDLGIPEQAQYIKSVEEMEAYRLAMQQKTAQELLESTTAPVFKTNLKDASAKEGAYAHFEARLEPIGDPTLKVDWLKDGRPIEASSRITTFFNFGYVALTIKALTTRDAGTYTCRAYNAKGEATNVSSLTVISKKDIESESQYEDTVMKMQYIEDAARRQRAETEESAVKIPPKFLGPLKGTTKIVEGQNAHFEVRLEPQNDPSMKVEWYFNGKILMDATRIKFYNDFGYVALDIKDVRSTDSGTYTVVARNAMGEAQLSANMEVEVRSSIDYSTMHEVTMNKTAAMERRHQEPHYDIEEVTKSKPVFTHPLQDVPPMPEGKNIHLEARLEPMGDPTMKVEWYFNGKPVTVGARFRTYFDFGYVALDIVGAYSTDTGEYTCRAENILGSAHTSSCIQIIGTGDIETDTMHDSAMEQIQYLEGQRGQRALPDDVDVNQPPTFTKSLKNIETIEGTNIHLEARLQPVGDTSMRVEWYFNDKPLKVGHRFRPAYDFDYVALDLLGVYPVDSGIYTCRATNKLGQAVTSASVRVMAKKDLIYDSDHPDALQKLQYLEDSSRYQRRDQLDEVAVKIKPKFLTAIKDQTLKENMTAHFEAKIEPITDANLRVEWYKDGRPLAIGSRFRTIHDFGYVALDIRNLVPEDSGVYTCVATNLLGKDEISASLKCISSSSIIMESQNESMTAEQLKMLEERRRYERTEVEETTKQAPVFTTSLKNIEILEGQRAHFEARLIPTSDPTMKVEWYCNNKLVKSGSRFTEYNDFGFIALDIMYAYAEDSGTYTCVATNALGQAITSASLVVHTKESIVLDSVNQEAMQQINRLESRSQRVAQVEEATFQAPVFTSPIKDQHLPENMPLHFEARLIPVGDPDLKVEWFRNGVPLQPANRISTMHDFGYVALDMKYVKPEDSAKESLLLETQHAEALEKLRYLEDSSRHAKSATEETVITQAPKFVVQLSGLTQLWEGQSAHVEGRIEPYPDPTMKVEWFHNGKPLTMYDFGFCALDILSALGTDSGTYEVRATNRLGTASSTININVKPKSDFIIDSQHPEAMAKIQRLEQKEGRKAAEETVVIEKPNFGRALRNQDKLIEGQAVHMEATLTPVNDPTMKVEWFFNGVPIPTGHRFRTTYDFGFVALDILYAYPEDSGTYMCRATNAAGQAVTSCNIKIEATDSMMTNTLDEERMRKIRKLEHVTTTTKEEVEKEHGKPVFTTALQSQDQVPEGHRVHLECRLEPVNDPNLKVEWFVNGVEIKTGHRFRTTHDFGYVALDILYAYEEDSGTYLCKATNLKGEAVNSCSVNVSARRSIYMDTQNVAGWEKIQNLEQKSKYERLEVEELASHPPRFTSELRGVTSLGEGQKAHIEGRIEPIHDPTMRIEWYHNGKVIQSAARFHTTFDFGYVAFDLSSVYPEDSGEYVCRAVNNMGEATSKITLKIQGTGSIIYESARPEGLEKIKELEDASRGPAQATEDLRTFQRPVFTQPLQNLDNLNEGETAHFECRLIPVGDPKLKVYEKPVFTTQLQGPSQVIEGQSAHYECKVIPVGDPNMKFEWYCNGVSLRMGSRFHTRTDFGFVTLDVLQTIPEDSGVYMCKAYNLAGEAVSSCSTRVIGRDSIIGDAANKQGWEAIRQREAQWNRVPPTPTSPEVAEPPMFTKHLESFDRLQEGGSVTLEAQVQPSGDPYLSIEWFKNGVQLALGTRIRSTFDFGHVVLHISGLRENDSGIYTCKAVNRVGEAVSTCNLKVHDRDWLIGESVRPEALPKLAKLEQPRGVPREESEPVYDLPVFITHLNNVECWEGDTAHFECNVEPSKDPTMKIEWFINGKPLQAAARYSSHYDFGFVTLDCNHCYEEDSGIYMCKATNSKGSASTTGTLKCISKANIFLDTQHPQGKAGLEKVEEAERAFFNKKQRPPTEEEAAFLKPYFIRPLEANFSLMENQTLHMEANVEPKKDPNLKIEWFLNGKPLEHGARYKSSYDFGLVTLDLNDCYERDQGIYTCRAYNKAGEAFCTSTVVVGAKGALIEGTQHPAGDAGLEAIQRMEESLRRSDRMLPDEEGHPPIFTTQFKSLSNIEESEIAHFEAMLTPVGDETMKVEWFYNGETLKASHRVRTVYAFGMVVLEILGTKVADTGEYLCRATNKWGQAECSCTLEVVDRAHGQPPKFTTHIQDIQDAKDGQSGHFECTLIPVGDPNMKVEWFHNGQPLRNATRIKTVCDFGYVVLDIAYLRNHDTGEWICKASNKYGEDYTKAFIKCTGKGGVYYDSLQPGSLDKIAELEASKLGGQSLLSPTGAGEPPKFITQVANIDQLAEGQSAHFEARLKPVGDPNLVVEWYKDGVKLTSKHRYRTFHDFGIVILDILYCYEEDSGVYEARAYNKLGEDKTSATLKCSSKANLILSPQIPKDMEGGLDKIQKMEDTAWMRRQTDISDKAGMPPKFTVPLNDIDGLKEGENAHFEARLVPTDDPRLKVEWYFNGKPMKHSSRVRQFCDFGFVIMEMSTVYAEDSGEYMCRAYNDYGEAVTKGILKCEGKRNIIFDSQLPKSMQGGMQKIAELEGLMIKTPDDLTSPDSGQPPQFLTQPADVTISENQLAHFECRLIPVGDPALRVEWYHNGRSLRTGTRIKTINDFGYVILELANCYSRDAGTYTCRAVNKHGEASVECKLNVSTKSGIILDPQATGRFKDCTESILKLEEQRFKKGDDAVTEDEKPNPPRFITNLENIVDLGEGQPAHFDCRVEPVGDPTMRIEWFHNGSQLGVGSRVHMMDDFGFVVLDLEWTFARDSGEYVCRATNKWGQATTSATLNIKSKHGVDMNTQLPQGMTAEKLKELERGPLLEKPDVDEQAVPPKFIVPLKDIAIEEGELARFEADVEPKTDPNLRIEWYFNGKPLQSGHRFRTSFEMGHVILELLYTYPEDSGEYICRAVNRVGQDATKASLKSKAAQCVIMQSQALKGVKPKDLMTQMEETMRKYNVKEVLITEEDIYDVKKRQPPRFITQIQENTSLVELHDYKFDCQLTPVGDPNMKVEWFFNGRPLPFKTRFTPIYDFGYVALIMSWLYGEDSGEYLCRATNNTPSTEVEEEKVRSKPEILKAPETILVQEGSWARFSMRVAGYPKPRVMWIVNGSTAVSGNRFKIWYDGMFHLDIPKTRQYDEGKIEVIARNSLGEAYATCELKVKPRQDDYRAVLKNSPKPWYDYDLKSYQHDRMDSELERVFEERVDPENAILHKSKFGEYMAKPVNYQEETEWQRLAREKNAGDKIKALEDEQRLRGRGKESHMFAQPATLAQQHSLAKGMASRYEENLAAPETNIEQVNQSREAQLKRQQQRQEQLAQQRMISEEQKRQELIRKQQEQQEFLKQQKDQEIRTQKLRETEPSESSVHGKEVHTSVQKQQQKEIQGDLEIHRKITTTEKTEMEHKGKTTERVVQGPVEPANPPFFTKKVQPCRAFEKEGARFEVEFEGEPRPTVQWYREDFPITSSPDFQIHTFGDKSILLIREVFMEDSGVFAVVAENRVGRAKCSANLVVEERKQSRSGVVPPSFTSTIQDVRMKVGSLVRLDAKIHGTQPIDVYWLKGGQKIQEDSRRKMVVEEGVNTLLILEAVIDDTGSYECVAINKAGEARCQADVIITGDSTPASTPTAPKGTKQAPTIIEKLKGHIVQEGQSARFECVVSGEPTPTVQWLKGNQVIKPSKYFTMSADEGRYVLNITEAFPEDEGTYRCILKNSAGKVELEAPLKVTQPQQVEVPPTLTQMKGITVQEGENITFSTTVSGKPLPKIQWYREGTLIPSTPDFEFIYYLLFKFSIYIYVIILQFKIYNIILLFILYFCCIMDETEIKIIIIIIK